MDYTALLQDNINYYLSAANSKPFVSSHHGRLLIPRMSNHNRVPQDAFSFSRSLDTKNLPFRTTYTISVLGYNFSRDETNHLRRQNYFRRKYHQILGSSDIM